MDGLGSLYRKWYNRDSADHTWSEFQHVSSSPSNINFLPNCFTSRFSTELTLCVKTQQQAATKIENLTDFMTLRPHLYKFSLLLDSSHSISIISQGNQWNFSHTLSHQSLHCRPHGRVPLFFISKFPTHYRQFRAAAPFTVICFPSRPGAEYIYCWVHKNTRSSFWKNTPLLFDPLIRSCRALGGERGRNLLCFTIHRTELDSLTPQDVATVSKQSEQTVRVQKWGA